MTGVTFLPDHRTVRVAPGSTVMEAANWAGISIENICGGRGTCGKCKVKLVEGLTPASVADLHFLSPVELDQGWRLACYAALQGDAVVEVTPPATISATRIANRSVPLDPNVRKIVLRLPEPSLEDPRPDLERLSDALCEQDYCAGMRREPGSGAGPGAALAARPMPQVNVLPSVWSALPNLLRASDFCVTAVLCGNELIAVEAADPAARNLGLALDIGTTTIAAAIVDLQTGATLATGGARNAQAAYGADVIERISYTTAHKNGLVVLGRAVVETINELAGKLLAGCGARHGDIYEAVAAGNTVMLHLLLGIPPAAIGVAPFIPVLTAPVTVPAARLGLRLHPEARLSTLPHIGAYVGADIVAGLLATNLLRREDGKRRLYLDIGTNVEIVLSAGERSVCTAAPAGPAFEGAHIECGMRAGPGAIEGVDITEDVRLRIIGCGGATGICGSGLVCAVAAMLNRGLLDSSGRLMPDGGLPETLSGRLIARRGMNTFLLSSVEDNIYLTQADIRALQLAKAAIASATEQLLARLGIHACELDEVLLAGAFGSSIDPASARAIGMVPRIPLERITAVGNAAAAGAQIALLSSGERQAASQIPSHVEYLELSASAGFDERFTEALAFPPPAANRA